MTEGNKKTIRRVAEFLARRGIEFSAPGPEYRSTPIRLRAGEILDYIEDRDKYLRQQEGFTEEEYLWRCKLARAGWEWCCTGTRTNGQRCGVSVRPPYLIDPDKIVKGVMDRCWRHQDPPR